MRHRETPTFYDFDTVTFLDIRSCTQKERWLLQAIRLIDMEIPYYIQKRSLLVIYAEGIQLENLRLRIFQEQIKIPFGKEEGSLQCSSAVGANSDIWTVDTRRKEAVAESNEGDEISLLRRSRRIRCRLERPLKSGR